MPYSADISRTNPGCFLFLIDQSGSMTEPLGGRPGTKKMDEAASVLNRTLDIISQRCSQGENIRDYFHIGVIGYNTDSRGRSNVRSLFSGTSVDSPFLSIGQVADIAELEERQVRESDGAGGLVEVTRRVPIWIRPEGAYGTPMCEALDLAAVAVREWIEEHRNSYPPIVINISDGMAGDGDPEQFAQAIMDLKTEDGNALAFNCHLSAMSAAAVQYPGTANDLPEDYAVKLFRMSSILPESNRLLAESLDIRVGAEARCFVYNADLEALVHFLDIGTRGVSSLDLN